MRQRKTEGSTSEEKGDPKSWASQLGQNRNFLFYQGNKQQALEITHSKLCDTPYVAPSIAPFLPY